MPVTARLSRKFYETFGEDVTNELVDWFNSVDATYRGDLRELNELNFGRFDAKLEQRLAELDAKWIVRWTGLDAKLGERIAELRGEIKAELAMLKGELLAQIGDLRGDTTAAIGRAQSATIKWMFTFWAPTAIAIIGTAIGVVALLLRR
ncbi:MAG: hypothetical protein Q8R92_08340 [Deltaproteobacteria bacterium]|nr:hypothetical protein [Deltaproteobacteria bacterium]